MVISIILMNHNISKKMDR